MSVYNPDHLSDRHRIEEEFHDARIREDRRKETYIMGPSNYAVEKLVHSIGDYQGKRVLEFGCGKDGLAIYLGRRGAIADGFDISGECVRLGNDLVQEYGLKGRVTLQKMSAEYLEYSDETFDIVVGNAILHHCDLPMTLEGIHRVLKKGGSAFFLEPLGHNILLQIYRILTPGDRTIKERPLKVSDFQHFEKKFSEFEHEELFLFSLACFFWNIVIPSKKMFEITFQALLRFDKAILALFPFLKRYCWIVLLKFKK